MSSQSELDTQIASAYTHESNWKLHKELLKNLRQNKSRRSDVVVHFGEKLLSSHSGSLGHEVWDVYEQVLIAALDCGRIELAEQYIAKLTRQFSNSTRVQRLQGMLLEAQGQWKEADQLYRRILEREPTDSLAMKRQIAVQKGLGNLEAACTLLDSYLTIWMADSEAWLELAHLRTTLGQYSQASFCYEELILAYPASHAHFTKYAELLYTMGGIENFKLARKYFAHSLELNNATNTRALWGLCATVLAIASAKGGKSLKDDGQEVGEWVEKQILEVYKNTDKLPVVKAALKKMIVI
jgi:tetratricopeptide (TPR) repeat protein